MTFKQQLLAATLGVLGVGLPVGILDYLTYHIAPDAVMGAVVFASIVGYTFGAWRVSSEEEEEDPDPKTPLCAVCGDPSVEPFAVWPEDRSGQ